MKIMKILMLIITISLTGISLVFAGTQRVTLLDMKISYDRPEGWKPSMQQLIRSFKEEDIARLEHENPGVEVKYDLRWFFHKNTKSQMNSPDWRDYVGDMQGVIVVTVSNVRDAKYGVMNQDDFDEWYEDEYVRASEEPEGSHFDNVEGLRELWVAKSKTGSRGYSSDYDDEDDAPRNFTYFLYKELSGGLYMEIHYTDNALDYNKHIGEIRDLPLTVGQGGVSQTFFYVLLGCLFGVGAIFWVLTDLARGKEKKRAASGGASNIVSLTGTMGGTSSATSTPPPPPAQPRSGTATILPNIGGSPPTAVVPAPTIPPPAATIPVAAPAPITTPPPAPTATAPPVSLPPAAPVSPPPAPSASPPQAASTGGSSGGSSVVQAFFSRGKGAGNTSTIPKVAPDSPAVSTSSPSAAPVETAPSSEVASAQTEPAPTIETPTIPVSETTKEPVADSTSSPQAETVAKTTATDEFVAPTIPMLDKSSEPDSTSAAQTDSAPVQAEAIPTIPMLKKDDEVKAEAIPTIPVLKQDDAADVEGDIPPGPPVPGDPGIVKDLDPALTLCPVGVDTARTDCPPTESICDAVKQISPEEALCPVGVDSARTDCPPTESISDAVKQISPEEALCPTGVDSAREDCPPTESISDAVSVVDAADALCPAGVENARAECPPA